MAVSILESELVRRFASRARIQIITDPAYADAYFRSARTINILVADSSFYGPQLEEHTIHHILLLAQEIGIEEEYPENIQRMMKYLPVDEIMQALEQFMEAEETAQREEILPDPPGYHSSAEKLPTAFPMYDTSSTAPVCPPPVEGASSEHAAIDRQMHPAKS